MDLYWIASSLRRQRAIPILIVCEIALTCAIICNTLFLVTDRIAHMHRASGVAEDELICVRIAALDQPPDARSITEQDLHALRGLPGATSAAVINMVPFGGAGWSTAISTRRDDPSPPITVALYLGSPALLDTLGVRVIAGRGFTPDDFVDYEAPGAPASIIITRGVAERMFPGANPIGQRLYVTGADPQRVIGVIDELARPNDTDGVEHAAYAVVVPSSPTYVDARSYVVRAPAARRGEILAGIDAALGQIAANRVIVARQPFTEIRDGYFRHDRAMIILLAGVSLAMLAITALGIVGLASFWVEKRTRQIGVRRALGATRRDILRYFQLENFALVSVGVAAGMLLAYAVNLALIHAYQVPRLPPSFLPLGALTLWLVGQLAVLGPARRGARISPAIATRSG